MDKDAEKRYRDLPPKEKYDSAIRAGEEPYSPGTEIRKIVRKKLGMDNENMAKPIELKAGKPSSEKPYELKPELKKKGGEVVKTLKNAGFYNKGKTKSEREKIVSKVTTKPQRIGMVEKMFSAKKMKAGGTASKRADGCATKGKTKGRMI